MFIVQVSQDTELLKLVEFYSVYVFEMACNLMVKLEG